MFDTLRTHDLYLILWFHISPLLILLFHPFIIHFFSFIKFSSSIHNHTFPSLSSLYYLLSFYFFQTPTYMTFVYISFDKGDLPRFEVSVNRSKYVCRDIDKTHAFSCNLFILIFEGESHNLLEKGGILFLPTFCFRFGTTVYW